MPSNTRLDNNSRKKCHFKKNLKIPTDGIKAEKGFPLVSIITIVYNGKTHLEQTILSVLQQSYANIEYLVIDGGSTDGTQEILRQYDDWLDFWVSEPDKGISDAFNKGISLSSGDLIGILNADDWYEPNTIETVVQVHRNHPNSIIHGNIQFWNAQNEPEYVFYGRDDVAHLRPTINHPTVFVPRTIYEKNGLFLLEFRKAMDFEWLGRAKLNRIPFIYLNTVLANMRRGGLSDKHWIESYWEAAKARKLHGTGSLLNCYLFIKSIYLTIGRKLLEFLGLKKFITIYRDHISIGRKRDLK